jgi:hypothetical protein
MITISACSQPWIYNTVMWIPIARPQLRKHVPARNNRKTLTLGHAWNTRRQQQRWPCFPCPHWCHTAMGGRHMTCFLWCVSISWIYKWQNSFMQLRVNNSSRSTWTSKQGDSYGKFVVEEELEVGLWRLNVWSEDFISVHCLECVIQWDCYSSHVTNPWRLVQIDWRD